MKKYVNNSFINKSPLEYKNGTEAVTSLPVTIFTDGQPVSSYTLKGNTTTSGTPSPTSPIEINGTGDRTANLFSIDMAHDDFSYNVYHWTLSGLTPNTQYTCSSNFVQSGSQASIWFGGTSSGTNGVSEGRPKTMTTNADGEIDIYINHNQDSAYDQIVNGTVWVMLNTGSTALPYEPYGYKIPISANGTALTPVYLTEQLMMVNDYADSLASSGTVTRHIKKIVFNGSETGWTIESGTTYVIPIADQLPTSYENAICSHYVLADSYNNLLNTNNTFAVSRRPAFFIHDDTLTSVEALKTYLAAQYAAGTPVTVYYVLETATIESVTAPSIPTTGGEVSIDVDTTVKPSEFDLTYHGWHSHEPLKRENGSWV